MMPAWITPEPAAPELLPAALCDEQRLWRAVLVQLLKDAEAWQRQKFSQSISRPVALDAWQAISENTPDYRRVAELAGVDHGTLRRAFLRIN